MKKWLIIYDICDAKRLQKTAKTISGMATRVQKSVFELEANDAQLQRLRRMALKTMDIEKDYLVCFSICEADWQKREKYGPKKFEEEPARPYYIY